MEALKFQARELAKVGADLRVQIHNEKGDLARLVLQRQKQAHSEDARAVQLAIAFLRRRPYRACEPTATAAVPRSMIVNYLIEFHTRLGATHSEVFLGDAILRWVAVPETEERRVWRLEREKRARTLRDARRRTLARSRVVTVGVGS